MASYATVLAGFNLAGGGFLPKGKQHLKCSNSVAE